MENVRNDIKLRPKRKLLKSSNKNIPAKKRAKKHINKAKIQGSKKYLLRLCMTTFNANHPCSLKFLSVFLIY